MNKIKIGLLGCGRISQFHLNALKEQAETYEIVAVADGLSERAQTMATQYHAKAYLSLEEMLKSEKLDLVVLCTPSGLHPAQAKVCAAANVACLSEKPFGCFYQEALDVVEFFEQRKVPLFVVHQNRYNPTVQKVRKWFEEGRLGKLYLIQANVFWQRPQSYYDAETWRGKRDLDGGAFMNQASHYVDLVQWFGGDIESVKSEVATLGRAIDCEDTGAAVIRFKSNAIGVIAVSMLTYPENQEGSLTFLAENATIKIGGKALNKLEICKAKDEAIFADSEQTNYEPATVYGNGHGEYYRQLAHYMKEPNHPEAINGREGLKSLKLLTDIYKEQDLAKSVLEIY
jgi:UDP-N-acetyl-2-amino-2-deoxyglucuronate dehydrogenase